MFDYPVNRGESIFADEDRLAKAIGHLMINAIKFKGGPGIDGIMQPMIPANVRISPKIIKIQSILFFEAG